jgi:hypothetical protein
MVNSPYFAVTPSGVSSCWQPKAMVVIEEISRRGRSVLLRSVGAALAYTAGLQVPSDLCP